jgi:hypothetical protein
MSTDINCMATALEALERTEPSERNGLYRKIVDEIKSYLQSYCTHQIIVDTVDIGPERSQTILYCEHCLQTFS